MNNFFCVVQILIFCVPLVQCACNADNQLYFFKIDLEEDYESQCESQGCDGQWSVYLGTGDWFYHDTWPGLDGAGIFEINSFSGTVGSWFELVAYFDIYNEPDNEFEFELKFYNEPSAGLEDVIVDGKYEKIKYLDTSTQLEWSIIKFYRTGALRPDLPKVKVLIPMDTKVFLIEYLSTRICDTSMTSTVPPETTTAPPNTTTVPPETTTAPPNTTTVRPETTTAPPNTTTVPPETPTVEPETTTVSLETTAVPPETTTVPPETTPPPTCTIAVPCCATEPWTWKWDTLTIGLIVLILENIFIVVMVSIISCIYCCNATKQLKNMK